MKLTVHTPFLDSDLVDLAHYVGDFIEAYVEGRVRQEVRQSIQGSLRTTLAGLGIFVQVRKCTECYKDLSICEGSLCYDCEEAGDE